MSKSFEQSQSFDTPPALRAVPSREEDVSIGGLLKQLACEIPMLFTKELALAKAEMRENLRATKAGVAAVATGGAVMLAGLIILLMAGVYGLSTVLAPWLSALIVGRVRKLSATCLYVRIWQFISPRFATTSDLSPGLLTC